MSDKPTADQLRMALAWINAYDAVNPDDPAEDMSSVSELLSRALNELEEREAVKRAVASYLEANPSSPHPRSAITKAAREAVRKARYEEIDKLYRELTT